jgi:hypothetical protein
MGKTRSLRAGIIITAGKVVIVVVALIVCLLVGALSLDAHDDGLLVIAAICAFAALGIAVLGAVWILRSVRTLVGATEK